MSQNVVYNGVTYTIPNTGDENWGDTLTTYLVAIPSGCLQKTGGGFTLLADVNFGGTYGLVSAYFKSRSANIAASGQLRLAQSDIITWRNQANSGDLALSVTANEILWDGNVILTTETGGVPINGKTLNDCIIGDYLSWTSAPTPPIPTVGFLNLFLNGSNLLSFINSDNLTGQYLDTITTQTATNKTFTAPVLNSPVVGDYEDMTAIASPVAPSAGKLRFYSKSDNNLYTKNSAGTELQLATVAPAIQTGVICMWSLPTPPTGFLVCDGSAVSRTTYSALFAALSNGAIWGTGDGSTTFRVPDMRGLFVRGVDQGSGRDPNAASRTATATGGATGNAAGSYEADGFIQHTHAVSDPGHNHSQNSHNHTQDAHNHTQNAHAHSGSADSHTHTVSHSHFTSVRSSTAPAFGQGTYGGSSIGNLTITQTSNTLADNTSTSNPTSSGPSTTGLSINNATATNVAATATNQAATATNVANTTGLTVGNSGTAITETRPKNVYLYYIIKT